MSEPMSDHCVRLARMYAAAPTNARYRDLALTIGEGTARAEVTVSPDMHHTAGAMHGAHYFKFLDDVAFFAVNSLVPEVFVLTSQFSVQLMRPVVEGRLRAEGRVTKPGRSVFFAESVLLGPDGKELGRGHGTFVPSAVRLAGIPAYADDPAPAV